MESDAISLFSMLMWSVGIGVGVALLAAIARMIGWQQKNIRDDSLVRREMIDECFARGQMTRNQCEGGRKARS